MFFKLNRFFMSWVCLSMVLMYVCMQVRKVDVLGLRFNRLKGPNFKATDDKVFIKVSQRPILKGGTVLYPAFMKVTVHQYAETTFVSPDDNIVTGPAVKVLIDPAPFINAQFLACTASKCKKPGLACADKIVGQPGVGGEKTSKNPGFRGLNDN